MAEKEVSHEEALKALGMETSKQPSKGKKKKRERYISQEGFVRVPVYRGFTEINKLYLKISPHGAIVLGGYVRYMCSPLLKPVPAMDIDIYSPTQAVFDEVIKELKEIGCEVKKENDLAILYKPFKKNHPLFPCPSLNLVKPMAVGSVVTQGDLETILENFDFTVARIGLLSPEEALADADFLHDEGRKFLRIKNIHCPVSTLYRVMKYNRKGYWPSTLQTIKILTDWENRSPEYRMKIIAFLQKENPTQEEIDEMEKMMRVFD